MHSTRFFFRDWRSRFDVWAASAVTAPSCCVYRDRHFATQLRQSFRQGRRWFWHGQGNNANACRVKGTSIPRATSILDKAWKRPQRHEHDTNFCSAISRTDRFQGASRCAKRACCLPAGSASGRGNVMFRAVTWTRPRTERCGNPSSILRSSE